MLIEFRLGRWVGRDWKGLSVKPSFGFFYLGSKEFLGRGGDESHLNHSSWLFMRFPLLKLWEGGRVGFRGLKTFGGGFILYIYIFHFLGEKKRGGVWVGPLVNYIYVSFNLSTYPASPGGGKGRGKRVFKEKTQCATTNTFSFSSPIPSHSSSSSSLPIPT